MKVKTNEAIPCDLVMLSSEDPEGECFITTANLDGETNLKVKAKHGERIIMNSRKQDLKCYPVNCLVW